MLFTMLFSFPIEKIEGHVYPISFFPIPNSVVEKTLESPINITIYFSGKPESKVGFIHVLDSNNKRIDNNDYTLIGKNKNGLTVTLNKDLISNGKYIVSWLTMSSDSGFITKGSYIFTIKITDTK